MRRVAIIGGPRCGKSTLARKLRDEGIPTFCTDNRSRVKDKEADVTYLDDSIKIILQSEYIARNWLCKEGPWCCEGVFLVHALRKMHKLGLADKLKGVEIIYLTMPHTPRTPGQIALAKAIETVWNQTNYAG